MAYAPEQPFPKTKGHVIKSKDWNDAILEIQRLDTAKVNRAGDNVTGSLNVAGNLGIGTTSASRKLHVQGTEIHSGGAAGGFSFGNREASAFVETPTAGERWVWFSSGGKARLWSGADRLSLHQDGGINILTIGPGANGKLKTRHIDGKHYQNDNDDPLYLNWGTGQPVVLGFGGPQGASQTSLFVSGNLGVGTGGPTHKFHVVAQDAVGLFESSGTQAFLRLSTNEGINNRVEITNRPGGRLSLWTAGGGDVFNITKGGLVGIGTTNPSAKLDVVGGDIRMEASRIFYSPGRMHINGEEILYLLNKSGVIISRAWGGNGNLYVDGEVRLGAADAQVHVGGNRTGPFLQLNDDLWFSDPQNGTIEIRNNANSNWGTLAGFFNDKSSAKYKKDTSVLGEQELEHLLDDTLKTDVFRYRYTGDEETRRLRLGVIIERCPEYLVGEADDCLSTSAYISMLHGALKALASKVKDLEAHTVSET